MVGSGPGASRLSQVWMWITERAARVGLPVSVESLCEVAVDRLGVSGAVLTIDNPGGDNAASWPEMRYSTNALSAGLAELEVTVGEGPCAQAHRTGGPVLLSDLASPANQRRYPLFASLAVEAGARAVFVFPLGVGTIQVGVLALHRVESQALDSATVTDALVFATLALRLLLDEQAGVHVTDDDLGESLVLHSPQVHQASGMISAQLDVPISEAFVRLRARAFTDQRPLAELAADVVARRLRFDSSGEVT